MGSSVSKWYEMQEDKEWHQNQKKKKVSLLTKFLKWLHIIKK